MTLLQPLRLRPDDATGIERRTLGRLVFDGVGLDQRGDCFFGVRSGAPSPEPSALSGYAGVLFEADAPVPPGIGGPVVKGYEGLGRISEGSVLAINPGSGETFILYRPESPNNSIFATGRCNSNCLMCSQPPTLSDDDSIVEEHLRLIDLIKEPPSLLGITGGEPTLLGDGLVSDPVAPSGPFSGDSGAYAYQWTALRLPELRRRPGGC